MHEIFWKAYDLALRRRRLVAATLVGGSGSLAASVMTPEQVAHLIQSTATEIVVRAEETARYMEAVLRALFNSGMF